jgi:hypothetical protein
MDVLKTNFVKTLLLGVYRIIFFENFYCNSPTKILLSILRPTPASQKTDGELPAEYVSSSLAQQSQV